MLSITVQKVFQRGWMLIITVLHPVLLNSLLMVIRRKLTHLYLHRVEILF